MNVGILHYTYDRGLLLVQLHIHVNDYILIYFVCIHIVTCILIIDIVCVLPIFTKKTCI
jgi:hypothetical protein